MLLVAGCSLVPQPDEPVWAVAIVNESAEEVVITLDDEGPGGRIVVEPCTSATHGLGPGTGWRVEFREPYIGESDVAFVPGAPVTVIEVVVSWTGVVTIEPPHGAATAPEAPVPDRCAQP
jgi:hypothetical protein